MVIRPSGSGHAKNGNLTNDGTNTYTWDALNQLEAISGPGLSASFEYDALGRRTSKTINGATTQFLYDRNDIVQESGASGVASYLRSLNMDEPFVRQSSSNEFYHTDALGTVLALTGHTGSVQTSYNYEPFGKTTITGTSTNPFQYTGRENDGTGLHYYRARYYSTTLGRFMSEDPILAPYTPLFVGMCRASNFTVWTLPVMIGLESDLSQQLNPYVYAKNNPILFSDPSGLLPAPDCSVPFARCMQALIPYQDKQSCIAGVQSRINQCNQKFNGVFNQKSYTDAWDEVSKLPKCADMLKGAPASCFSYSGPGSYFECTYPKNPETACKRLGTC